MFELRCAHQTASPSALTSHASFEHHRGEQKDKSCYAYNTGDLTEALTLSAGQQAPPDGLGYPAIPPPAPGPRPPPDWDFLKQNTALLMFRKHFDPSRFAAQKKVTEDQISTDQMLVAAAGGQDRGKTGRAADVDGHQAMPANGTRLSKGTAKLQTVPTTSSPARLTGG